MKHKLEDGMHGETLVGVRAKILLAMCMKGKSENDAHANKWRNSEIYHAFWVSLRGLPCCLRGRWEDDMHQVRWFCDHPGG